MPLTDEERGIREAKRAKAARDKAMKNALKILSPHFEALVIAGCTHDDVQGGGGVNVRVGKGNHNTVYGLLKRATNYTEEWDRSLMERDPERQLKEREETQ